MFNKLLQSLKKALGAADPLPSNRFVTPHWVREGQQAARQNSNLEAAFEEVYGAHVHACRQVRLPSALRPEAFEKFKRGWQSGL